MSRLWLLAWFALSSLNLAAEPAVLSGAAADTAAEATFEPADQTPSSGWLGSAGSWLEIQRNAFSEVVSDSAQGIDAYIAREYFDQSLANDSYLKVKLRQRSSKSGEQRFEATVRAKVRLPNSRRRLKLTFDSDPDDFDRIADRSRDQTPGFDSPTTLKESAIAGISLEKYLGENWESSYSLGVRLQLPLNPYARVSWTHSGSLGEHWQTRFKQGFSYFHSDRWKSETAQTFYRPLSERLLFQSGSGAQYLDRDDNWELFQNLSLHQRISADSAFEHQLGVSGDSRPALKANGYWLRTELRHRLYKDWLFVKLVPELYYARADHFQPSPSLLLELEIYFGKVPD